jgi:hypothetical protein
MQTPKNPENLTRTNVGSRENEQMFLVKKHGQLFSRDAPWWNVFSPLKPFQQKTARIDERHTGNTRTWVQFPTPPHTHTFVHTHARTHARTHTHAHAHTCIHPHTCVHTSTRAYTHIRAYTHLHTHARASTHPHTHVHPHIHTRIHTYTHSIELSPESVHIHTPTHTPLLKVYTPIRLRTHRSTCTRLHTVSTCTGNLSTRSHGQQNGKQQQRQ